MAIYGITGNFQGVQFSQFSRMFAQPRKLNPRNKLDCTVHNECEYTHPQKLDPQNCKDQPSTKIEPHKNFPLYGSMYIIYSLVIAVHYYMHIVSVFLGCLCMNVWEFT